MSGKKSANKGADTERRVWYDLLSKNYIATKWHNNVDLENDKIIMAKPGFFKRTTTGFPDFMYYKIGNGNKEVVGLEVKSDGQLRSIEKQKCKWLIKNKIFDKIEIAKREKIKNKIIISYKEFK